MNLSWFKLNANFDKDDRITMVESQRNGSLAIYHYIKLHCIAARCNQGGGIFLTEGTPYTPKSLAIQWRCKVTTVNNSIDTLVSVGLLEIIDGVIFIADWASTQSSDKLEEIRKYEREKKQKWREKKKALSREMSTDSHAIEEDKEKEIEIEKEIDLDEDEDIINEVIAAYNAAAVRKIEILSVSQKGAVINAVKEYGIERLKQCISLAGESDFLNGKNSKGWVANFDWLIRPENIAKVLNGNYDTLYSARTDPAAAENMMPASFDDDEFIQAALKRGFDGL